MISVITTSPSRAAPSSSLQCDNLVLMRVTSVGGLGHGDTLSGPGGGST